MRSLQQRVSTVRATPSAITLTLHANLRLAHVLLASLRQPRRLRIKIPDAVLRGVREPRGLLGHLVELRVRLRRRGLVHVVQRARVQLGDAVHVCVNLPHRAARSERQQQPRNSETVGGTHSRMSSI